MARNGIIGKNNTLPWHLPEDMKHFKHTTMGHCLIMGRKTWESIGRPLPGRNNIVISTNPIYQAEGAQVANSLPDALALCQNKKVFIIGGAKIYEAAFPLAQHFYLTRVHAEVEGDTMLQGFVESEWREIKRKDFSHTDNNPYDYSICLLERVEGN